MELLIKNGILVTPEQSYESDILVRDGRIAQIGKNLTAQEVFDAAGCRIFSGFIDAHTHLDMDNGVTFTADNFATGTIAAACGGTTTLVDFATQDRGGTLAQALSTWHSRADGNSSCDYAFHMAITDWNPETRKEIAQMVKAGVSSFKLYLAYDNLRVTDAELYEALKAVGEVHGIVGVHCENGDLVNELVAENRAAGNLSPKYHPLSRPDYVEAEAVARYCYIAQAAGVPVNIVHLSTKAGLEEALRARARGQKVYIETCPQYLSLTDEVYRLPDFESAKYVCSPPVRSQTDRDALWEAVRSGVVDTISTDHCSFNFKGQKELGLGDFSKIPNGMPGLEQRPALLYTLGVATGRITENQMAAMLSERTARLFGMYPQKGALAVGSDADLVVWDPSVRGVITAGSQHNNCDYTPYEGMETQGRAKAVFLRGEQIVREGEPLATGKGRYVARHESEYL